MGSVTATGISPIVNMKGSDSYLTLKSMMEEEVALHLHKYGYVESKSLYRDISVKYKGSMAQYNLHEGGLTTKGVKKFPPYSTDIWRIGVVLGDLGLIKRSKTSTVYCPVALKDD